MTFKSLGNLPILSVYFFRSPTFYGSLLGVLRITEVIEVCTVLLYQCKSLLGRIVCTYQWSATFVFVCISFFVLYSSSSAFCSSFPQRSFTEEKLLSQRYSEAETWASCYETVVPWNGRESIGYVVRSHVNGTGIASTAVPLGAGESLGQSAPAALQQQQMDPCQAGKPHSR